MMYYSFDLFKNDVPLLGKACESFKADTIVGIARGGVMLAHALCMYLDLRNLQTIRTESYDGKTQRESVTILGGCDFTHSKKVLIVDDIVDSGKTITALLSYLRNNHPDIEFQTASLYYKKNALIQPDFSLYEAKEWINFFWEVDFLKEPSL